MALQIADLKVRSLDLDYYELSWRTDDSLEDPLDYVFRIQRSEAPEGPFDSISQPFSDIYSYIDNARPTGNRYRNFFYRIEVVHRASGAVSYSETVNLEPPADLIAAEIRRHMQMLFRGFVGRVCWLLPVRTFGMRCPTCYNPKLQKSRTSSCPTCFSTTFVRGYHRPIEIYISIDPSPNNQQNNSVGPIQPNNTTARLPHSPQIKVGDVIVEAENRRWRVTKVTTTEHLRAPLHQELEIHEIPPKDIEFNIPLDLGQSLKSMWLADPRNFLNPYNLDVAAAAADALPDDTYNMLDLYNRGPRV